MKTVNLEERKFDLEAIINLALKEPFVLLAVDGKEFVLAEADDFEREVEALCKSQAFQHLLDERSQSVRHIPLEEVEAEIEGSGRAKTLVWIQRSGIQRLTVQLV
ncbi:MAG: hypothetical protein U1F76_31945 [Candidatus Competibacteraceae bacterium]